MSGAYPRAFPSVVMNHGVKMMSMREAIGGEAGCMELASAFYSRVASDPVLRPLFPGRSMRCATEELAAFLVQFLGGDDAATQYRWWLSLRESHGRFSISEVQRDRWLAHMEATLAAMPMDPASRHAFAEFFAAGAAWVTDGDSRAVTHPELAARWSRQLRLDAWVADLIAGDDDAVVAALDGFEGSALRVGMLARMAQTGRPPIVAAVEAAIDGDPRLVTAKSGGQTLLHYAAGAGCPSVVARLLAAGANPDVRDRGDHTALYRVANGCATEAGPTIVRMLVAAGADVNDAGGSTRSTPLHMAARQGHVLVAGALLEAAAATTARDSRGHTPLDRAVRCRRTEIVRLLSVTPAAS